ncbi:MAG: TolC family protein, partial [Prolixibacteraceae bacterium]
MKQLFLLLFLLNIASAGAGQDVRYITLEDAIDIATSSSLDAFRNENMYLAGYWEFRNFKAERLPSLWLRATPLDYNRSMQKVYNYDENRDEYKLRENIDSEVSLLLNQNVGLTGGQIFARSELNLTQKLGDNQLSSYSSTPFSIGYSQNINGYNRLKWTARIEPLKFEKSKKNFIQSKEELAIKANSLFFNLVDAQIEVNIAETNVFNTDTLLTIGQG